MNKHITIALTMLAGITLGTSAAEAVDIYGRTNVQAMNFAATRPWHSHYQYSNWGAPVAMVVPPTAHMQTNYSWGVSQNLMYPIHHQFNRNMPQPMGVPYGQFRPTPHWPSHTDQFGVHYIRGPW
ncbi:hypothetical protein Poly24_47640 [Rosistilla carotiformis]|uniref:Uncharacterized protein n=1 Tax=Rosistilla carotiformis TaxID=2528017 RepID=A0A518JZQ7_9BACT|nr:hypothetical protein [Rosistilla carotiformis]QDV71031.1 hypothetical protein Poly24_47640 [Rosistilla carotiformis]